MARFNAIVMAAGRGTRMRSARPKVLHELCGRPLVCWPVLAAREAGAVRIVVVQSPDAPLTAALPPGVEDAIQSASDGTGGAVAAALAVLAGDDMPIVVLSGDVPLVGAGLISELLDSHERGGAAATMLTATLADPSGYGRVVRDRDGEVTGVVETKADGDASAAELAIDEVNSGIFCFEAEPLVRALAQVGSDNAQGERYLPDVLPLLRAAGQRVVAHRTEDPSPVLGINDRAALAAVARIAQQAICERHMAAGVTIVDPQQVTIDVGVRIGPDTVLEPGTHLRGTTVVGDGATIGPHVVAVDAEVADGATVGPFAYLRPGAEVGRGAKVGTFVEVKNSRIGAGAKVPHLSYVGDADVGAGANLGAATITANYDGRTKKKSRTTIGAQARTGVLTALVAPVELGEGAYTAAGSVVTKDVPDGALAVARSRQTNIDGYSSR